jgi:hypothetical protein
MSALLPKADITTRPIEYLFSANSRCPAYRDVAGCRAISPSQGRGRKGIAGRREHLAVAWEG